MVSFELGKEIEIDVFVFSRAWNKEKILSSSSIRDACSTPHGDSESFPCPTLVTRLETSSSISLPSSKLTIFLILFYSDELTKLMLLLVAWYLQEQADVSRWILLRLYHIRSTTPYCQWKSPVSLSEKEWLNTQIKRKMFSVLSQAWDEEKILSSHEQLSLSSSDSALWCSTTEPQRLRWARSITKFIWHTSCILLGSTMSIASCL